MPEDQFYPAWRFHPTLPGGKIFTAEECAALGDDWVDSPAKLPEKLLEGKIPPAPPAQELSPPDAGVSPDPAPPKKSHHKKKEPAE